MHCCLRTSSSQASREKCGTEDPPVTSVSPQPVVASPVKHHPAPDLAHSPNTIKGSLGKRPVDIDDFITYFEPAGERIDRHLGDQGCASHHRSGRSVIDRS